jgi:hypothetical protein
MVTPLNALLILEVIEEGVKQAGLSKRKKLRTKAQEIVKDLYDTNHTLLRKHGVEDKVQSCYRRLGE